MKAAAPDIITIPNPLLRLPNKPITQIDKKARLLLDKLRTNLLQSGGVGLAAPQIGANYQVFVTNLSQVLPNFPLNQDPVRFFFNPKLVATASERELTKETDGTYTLEGCLSLPQLFAPVPRYQWVTLEFQELDSADPSGTQLVTKQETFTDFYARNIQHEFDHLQGILFTDYLKNTNLALYRGNSRSDDLTEVEDLSFLAAI